MKYLTGCYCASPCPSLLLLQVVRLKNGLPIMLAVVWEEQAGKVENPGDKDFGNSVMEWFERQALPACVTGNAAKCVKSVGRCLEKWMKLSQAEEGKAWVMLFGVGEMCFYAWKGRGEIYLSNLCFDHLSTRKLSYDAEDMQLQFAELEPDVGILLGTSDLFARLPKKLLNECFAVSALGNGEQVDKHLKEAVQEAVNRGAGHPAAILAITRED